MGVGERFPREGEGRTPFPMPFCIGATASEIFFLNCLQQCNGMKLESLDKRRSDGNTGARGGLTVAHMVSKSVSCAWDGWKGRTQNEVYARRRLVKSYPLGMATRKARLA